MERKEFKTTGVNKTGLNEDVTVFFGTMRGEHYLVCKECKRIVM